VVKLRLWLEAKYGAEDLPAERTLHRWLKNAHKVKRRRVHHKAGKGMACSIKADRPNAIWTVDFKGDWWTADGQRLLVLTVRDLHSRFVLCVRPLKAASEELVRRVFTRLFARYGQPAAIRSDQGAPFCGVGPFGLTRLSIGWMRRGIEVQFVHRGSGIDNNAHEEMHRCLKREATTPPSRTYSAQVRRLYRWQVRYNQTSQRCLGKKSPQQLYQGAIKSLNPLGVPTYPAHWLTRKVRSNGAVKLHGSLRHIGRAFTDLTVAFEPIYFGYLVHFMHLTLGSIDPHKTGAGLRTFRGKRSAAGGYAPGSKPSKNP
jgi:transposase InsO family protein